ncbi:MAG: GMC family oxidoreductase N-terminal domain-containing protein [Rubricoccaceae bacterium]
MVDYVIVGAGSAGCVLANRLSANPEVSVLLLEAGGKDTQAPIHIPAAFSKLFQTEADWNYRTVPQEHAAGRDLYWPRGKVLGGSSSINAMIYIRGHHADYDGWAAEGCEGWSYADVLPYFKRSEDSNEGASAYHGVGGPMPVTEPRSPSPFSLAFVEAATQAGHPRNDDFNGAEQEGAGLYALTQAGGRRASTASTFLKAARRRPNLTVETGAHATRVLIRNGRATGVEIFQNGEVRAIDAAKEVILCGGAINSPQLLMLSGIGPADHLAHHGVAVVADRAGVGQNLHDHPIVGVHYRFREPISLLGAEGLKSIARYLILRDGMLSSNVAEAGLFVRTRGEERIPNVQFHVAPTLFKDHGLVPMTEHGFSLGPTLVRPRSRGALTLASSDPFDHPHIDPNYLADPADAAALVAGIRIAREIVAQPALDSFRGEEIRPSASATTDTDLDAYVRETCETLYHPVGTCRMGADDDSVVDLDLRVRGVDGLRVVDASIMPTIPNGNTNAPVLMIAEKAADRILTSTASSTVGLPEVL